MIAAKAEPFLLNASKNRISGSGKFIWLIVLTLAYGHRTHSQQLFTRVGGTRLNVNSEHSLYKTEFSLATN
jgi:hypothetical protein